jgi:uncharacterized protein YrrD
VTSYTTTLLLPDYLQEQGEPVAYYVAYNEAADVREAIKLARQEAVAEFKKDAMIVRTPLDLALVHSFHGWPPVALYGFQE